MKLLGLATLKSAAKLEVSLPKGLGGFDTLSAGFHGNVFRENAEFSWWQNKEVVNDSKVVAKAFEAKIWGQVTLSVGFRRMWTCNWIKKTSARKFQGLSCIETTRNGRGQTCFFFSIEETSSWKTDVFLVSVTPVPFCENCEMLAARLIDHIL